MGVADGDGERIDTRQADKLHGFIGMGINAAFGVAAALLAVVVLGANEHAQFPLDDAVMLVGVLDDPPADFGIFFHWLVAAIDHHAGKAFVDTLFAKLE